MKNKYVSLAKDIIIFGLGSVGSKLILFFMVPLYTNFLTDEEYGISELVFTISQLLIPFVSVVIFDAVVRFGLAKDQKKENVLLCGLLVVLIGSLITIAVTPLFGLYDDMSEWKWYMCIYVIVSMVGPVEMNYLKVKDQNKLYALLSVLQTLVLAILNVILLIYLDWGIEGYLLSSIAANVFLAVVAFLAGGMIKDLKQAVFSKQLLWEMLAFSVPLILNNVSWWVIQSSNRVFVEMMIGVSALGIYTVATKIPSLINVITSIFSQAWGISSVKEFESTSDAGFYGNVFDLYQAFVFGVAVFAIPIVKPFMTIYVGDDFFSAWQYIPILLVSAAFSAVAGFYGTLYGALKRSINNMLTTIAGAVINIAVNILLIPVIGVWGAVLGMLATYVVISALRMIDIKRYLDLKINKVTFAGNIVIVMVQSVLISFGSHIAVTGIITILLFIFVNRKGLISICSKATSKLGLKRG